MRRKYRKSAPRNAFSTTTADSSESSSCTTRHTDTESDQQQTAAATCSTHADRAGAYYCQTCRLTACRECHLASHCSHASAPLQVLAERTRRYLSDAQQMTDNLAQAYEYEVSQMDKYLRQYECDKEKVTVALL